MSEFIEDIAGTKKDIDNFLEDYINRLIKDADKISESYGDLWRTIGRAINRGGKRMRPYIIRVSYESFGGSNNTLALRAGVASELLHAAILIHDDIIDRDTIRYGTKNVTGQYQDKYSGALKTESERDHFANSAAIIAGDLLISEAYRIMSSLPDVTDEVKARANAVFAESIFAVCGGELLDTEASFDLNSADPMKIAVYKTASYSFTGPMLIGATLAGESPSTIQTLRKISKCMGIIFQLRDDMLGIFGNSKITGKTNTGDIREGKKTLLVAEFKRLADTEEIKEFEKIFGVKDLQESDYIRAANILKDSGAKKVCDEKISQLAQECTQYIDELHIEDIHKQKFIRLLNFIEKRDK